MERIEAPGRRRTYPLEMDDLPEEFVKKAEVELNETPENKRKCMRQLRELVESDSKAISNCLNDDFLLMFLRWRKFDVQKAFDSLNNCVSFMRSEKKHLILKPHIADIYAREKILSYLPHRDKDGSAIALIRLNRWDPTVADVDDCFSCNFLLAFEGVRYPMSQVNGLNVMIDFNVNVVKYIRYCTPYYARIVYGISQKLVPARIKSIHIVNPSIFFRLFWAILSNFLPYKLTRRVFVHGNPSGLKNHFPESLIPEYLGGRLEDQDISEWVAKAKFPDIVGHVLSEREANAK